EILDRYLELSRARWSRIGRRRRRQHNRRKQREHPGRYTSFQNHFSSIFSHSPWAKDRPTQADRPLFMFTIWRVRNPDEEPPLHYKTHAAEGSFITSAYFRPGPSVYR